MKGFAFTDALIALALITLILAILVSRAPTQSLAEAERRIQATLIDAAQASLVLSQGLNTNGRWLLFDAGVMESHPSPAFAPIRASLHDLPSAPYRLTLRIEAVGQTRRIAVADVVWQGQSIYSEEVSWSVNPE